MIITDSNKTVEFLLENFSCLKNKWHQDYEKIFLPLTSEYKSHVTDEIFHNLNFQNTGTVRDDKINILFSHFSFTKYELEALELPLYASKIFPHANIDMCYFDSRGRMSNGNSHYLASVHEGTTTRPKSQFLDYDIIVGRSTIFKTMAEKTSSVLRNAKCRINIQTNNYTPNFGIGEDHNFCYTEFFAPGGRKFSDQACENFEKYNFQKQNIIVMVGSIIWWKGQAEWLENIDGDLLKDHTVVIFGNIYDNSYWQRITAAAARKNVNLLYSKYVNPKFLCDVLSLAKIKVMNHYPDPPEQPVVGPARTFGEALSCKNICLLGQKYVSHSKIGKTNFLPAEWNSYTVEYDQNHKNNFDDAFVKAKMLAESDTSFSELISIEQKCDQILEKCLNLFGTK